MNPVMMAVDVIKQNVSAQDVARMLGWEIRNGRCKCPIHGGHDFNCRVYAGDRGFYCHVCKTGGDVIKLVQQYHELSFKDSVSWINDAFHLGLDLDRKIDPDEARRAEMAQRMRKNAIEFSEWKSRTQLRLAMDADRILEGLEEQRDRNAPKTPDEPWNDAFCTAVRLIPVAKRFAENCMAGCLKGACNK